MIDEERLREILTRVKAADVSPADWSYLSFAFGFLLGENFKIKNELRRVNKMVWGYDANGSPVAEE